jgi:hypothetical protein
MPTSLIAAEAAIALLVVYLTVLLWLDIQYALSGESGMRRIATPLLHLAWSVTALIGIPFKCRPAWRLACGASAFFAAWGVFGGVFSLFLALFGNSLFVSFAIRLFSTALYLFVVHYLLSRPTSADYFVMENVP